MPGDILIKQGDSGEAASELYVVVSGEFEVLDRRGNASVRVALKGEGDVFGEVALLFDQPRNATVAATGHATAFVLERHVFKHFVRGAVEDRHAEMHAFMRQVPLLQNLGISELTQLADAFGTRTFPSGSVVMRQGDPGDFFYLVKSGEAEVTQHKADPITGRPAGADLKVNSLFRSDFFGEAALLDPSQPRVATVRAVGDHPLVCLALDQKTFTNILGPLSEIMKREKSPAVTEQKLRQAEGKPSSAPADVILIRTDGRGVQHRVKCRGHLDQVMEIKATAHGKAMASGRGGSAGDSIMILHEGQPLGDGAFSRVTVVREESTGREFALKRMNKSAVVKCSAHIFCEQSISKNSAHPFCIRQYASFQDAHYLYMLFDLMSGGDLMDLLVADAKVVRHRPVGGGCLAKKVRSLQGVQEDSAKFYVASVALALEYLHGNDTVYRDLKPENVLVDGAGYVKLGDFGFAKCLEGQPRTFTFCGTPGYVAPENILTHGYGMSVDWWGLGVLTYVLLTGKQPFSGSRSKDPMDVMRNIVDDRFQIRFPVYMSDKAKDFVLGLLQRNPAQRLGMLAGKARDVKRHPWFDGFDWIALEQRKMPAPRLLVQEDKSSRIAELGRSDADELPNDPPELVERYQRVFANF